MIYSLSSSSSSSWLSSSATFVVVWFSCLLHSSSQVHASMGILAGLQSNSMGDTGSSFASAAVYSPLDQSLIITGSTYGRTFQSSTSTSKTTTQQQQQQQQSESLDLLYSQCFVTVVSMNLTEQSSSLSFTHSQQGFSDSSSSTSNAACYALHSFGNKNLLIAGHGEERYDITSRTATEQESFSKEHVEDQYGFLLDFSLSTFTKFGARHMNQQKNLYPVAMTSFSDSPTTFYVAYVQPEDEEEEEEDDNNSKLLFSSEIQQQKDPSQLLLSQTMKGSSLQLSKFQIYADATVQRLEPSWDKPIGISSSSSSLSSSSQEDDVVVQVADMIAVSNNRIVIAGTSTSTSTSTSSSTNGQGENMQGFVTILDASTGNVLNSIPIILASSDEDNDDDVLPQVDHVNAICADDTKDSLYVVGTTTMTTKYDDGSSSSSSSAMLLKYELSTLQDALQQQPSPVWMTPIHSVHPNTPTSGTVVQGMACAVRGSAVWVGGNVLDGGVIVETGFTQSYGGTDVFAAKFNTHTGLMQVVRQIGSTNDDVLATNQNGLLIEPSTGNAILIGNTYGSLYRERSQKEEDNRRSDVFVMTIHESTGEIQPPVQGMIPTGKYTGPGRGGNFHTNGNEDHNGNNNNNNRGGSNIDGTDANGGKGTFLMGLLIFCILGVALCYVYRQSAWSRSDNKQQTDRKQVVKYLHEFGWEEVDLKRSATGGFHGSYLGKVAQGRRPSNRLSRSSFKETNSSFSEDDDLDDSSQNMTTSSYSGGDNDLEGGCSRMMDAAYPQEDDELDCSVNCSRLDDRHPRRQQNTNNNNNDYASLIGMYKQSSASTTTTPISARRRQRELLYIGNLNNNKNKNYNDDENISKLSIAPLI